MSDTVTLRTVDRVAVISLNNPPVNSLSKRLVEPLIATIEKLSGSNSIDGIVIRSDRDGVFVSGADLTELSSSGASGLDKFVPFLDRLEALQVPVLMLIEGQCLGGGLELAMAGHYRLVTSRAVLGLVECKLGLIPGAAGTQRLPRLVGVSRATRMMLLAETVRADQAVKIGLADQILSTSNSQEAEKEAIRIVKTIKNLKRASQIQPPAESSQPAPELILKELEKRGKTKGLIHLDLCLDAILTGVREGYKIGLQREKQNFAKCVTSPQAQGLLNIFFAQRSCAKVPGVTDKGFSMPKLQTMAVLGGGTMGAGIAAWLLMNRVPTVLLKEVNDSAAKQARGRVRSYFSSQIRTGKMTDAQLDGMLDKHLKLVTNFNEFKSVDLVIEAIFEDIDLKRRTFKELEQVTRPDCILASNTSTIDIDIIGSHASPTARERILGIHFFAPVPPMPLVEIIPSKVTRPEITNAIVQLVKKFRKTPVVVGNCPGFLVNRIFCLTGPVYEFLMEHGVDPQRIDRVVENFGSALGPLKTADLSGIDIIVHVSKILRDAYPDIYPKDNPNSIPKLLVKAKRLGQKTGVGYFRYQGRQAVADPELQKFVDEARQSAGTKNNNIQVTDDDIVQMLFFPVINEGLRCLNEGIAIRPTDIDVSSVLGMGFGAHRGGVMNYGKQVGYNVVFEKLSQWYTQYKLPLFKPTTHKFYSSASKSSSTPSQAQGSDNSDIDVPGFAASNVFCQIRNQIKHNPEMAKSVNACFCFDIKAGDKTQKWTVDLKKGVVLLGDQNSECTLKLNDEAFVKLLTGKLDPMSAFMSGQLKITGDMTVAFKLQKLKLEPQAKL